MKQWYYQSPPCKEIYKHNIECETKDVKQETFYYFMMAIVFVILLMISLFTNASALTLINGIMAIICFLIYTIKI